VSQLEVTDNHPFWNPVTMSWVRADSLVSGDRLASVDGDRPVVNGTQVREVSVAVFNLTVDDLHTFFVVVGDEPVLTHNAKQKKCDPVTTAALQKLDNPLVLGLQSDGIDDLAIEIGGETLSKYPGKTWIERFKQAVDEGRPIVIKLDGLSGEDALEKVVWAMRSPMGATNSEIKYLHQMGKLESDQVTFVLGGEVVKVEL
jgi:hypothetical protein